MKGRWSAVRELAERLTLPERWLIFGFAVVAGLGAVVKYCRERPEVIPASPRGIPAAMDPRTD